MLRDKKSFIINLVCFILTVGLILSVYIFHDPVKGKHIYSVVYGKNIDTFNHLKDYHKTENLAFELDGTEARELYSDLYEYKECIIALAKTNRPVNVKMYVFHASGGETEIYDAILLDEKNYLVIKLHKNSNFRFTVANISEDAAEELEDSSGESTNGYFNFYFL